MTVAKRKRPTFEAPRSEPYSRVTPVGFKHGMKPFFVGIAAAEFAPADPAQWIELAIDAGVRFAPIKYGAGFAYDPNSSDVDRREFLIGWMCGTPDGKGAIGAYITEHKISTWDMVE